jgi:hypothetical protein
VRSAEEIVRSEGWIVMAIGIALSLPIVPWLRARVDRQRAHWRVIAELAWMASLGMLLVLSVASLAAGGYNPFIYFRF